MLIKEVYDDYSQVLVKGEIPDYLYTCTYESRLDDIDENGLGNKLNRSSHFGVSDNYHGIYSGNGVFLARDYDNAIAYYADQGFDNDDHLVVLLVPTRYLDRNKLYYDMNEESTIDYLNGDSSNINLVTYFYNGIINNPKDKLEIID